MLALFEELKQYVGFGPEDEAALRAVHPGLAPHFAAIAEVFYARALAHEDAARTLARGERHVGQLKVTLVKWMGELLTGPWDAAYVERRARIGRVHVHIALPQHFMVSAMHVMRSQLQAHAAALHPEPSARGRQVREALAKICDLDLALMLHTFREDLEARQARDERLTTFGQLVGSIGHELRNPLGVIETSLYVLKSRPVADERTQKHLDRIGQQVTLANDIITQLLNLIRERPLQRSRVALGPHLADALAAVPRPEGVELEAVGLDGALTVEGDATQLRQVVVNLVENAVQAAGPSGQVRLTLAGGEGVVVLTVDDSGPGIHPSIRNRLFEPLVSARPGGVGLGLALVRRIVERHSGSIDAGRGPLGGARFTVRLPLGREHA